MSLPPNDAERSPAHVALGWALASGFLVVAFLGLRSDALDHGDVHTDQRAVVAAVALARTDNDRLHWLQTEDLGHEFGLTPAFYFRHPTGGVLVLEQLLRAGWPLSWCRLAPLIATTIGLVGFWLYVRRSTGNGTLAIIAMALLAVAAPFYLLSDSFQLYSWALGVKGLAFLFIADATAAVGGRRVRAIALLFLSCLVGVAACGLETMPAIGLLSVLHPLLVSTSKVRGRLLLSVVTAAAAGSGMIAGWAARLPGLIRVLGSIDAVIHHLAVSVVRRSAGDLPTLREGRGYAEEVAHRLVDFVPLHLVLTLLAIGWLIAATVRRRRLGAGAMAGRALAAIVVAEWLYVVVMRQHVSVHVHTTVHVTFSLAFGAALALEPVRATLARRIPALAAGGAIAALIVGSAFVFPIRTYSNLEAPGLSPRREMLQEAVTKIAKGLPDDAVVLISDTKRGNWTVGVGLALAGRSFASNICFRGDRRPVDVFELAVEMERPLYVITYEDDDPALGRLRKEGVLIAQRRTFKVFAFRNYDPATLPIVPYEVTAADLARATRTRPGDEALQKAGVRYALHGPTARGFWFSAPPRNVGGETRVVVPIPVPHQGEARLAFEVLYEAPTGGKDQPTLVFEAAVEPEGEAASRPPPFAMEIEPGRHVTDLSILVPEGGASRQVAFTLRRKDGDSRTSRPAVEVRDILLHHRPAAPRAATGPLRLAR